MRRTIEHEVTNPIAARIVQKKLVGPTTLQLTARRSAALPREARQVVGKRWAAVGPGLRA